jgi:hypothetical protein
MAESGFDAELYLRTLGEDTLLGIVEDHHDDFASLKDAATVLVAIDEIEVGRAREVLGDYAAAAAARGGFHGYLHQGLERPTPRQPPSRRVVALGDELELPSGRLRLRYAVLNDEATEISAVYTTQAGTSAHTSWLQPAGLPQATVTDDRGTTAGLTFNGGGGDEHWEGTFTADQPIAADTSWIEIYDHRIPLVGAPVESTVDIQPLPPTDLAHAQLWRRVSLGGHHFRQSELAPTVDALVAAGRIDRADPEIELADRVLQAIPRHWGPSGTTNVRGAPDPWASLLRRSGRTDGPPGMVVVGAITPEFERHFVAVDCLESGAEGFSVEASVSPRDVEPHPGNLDLEQDTLIWWARDDRENHYLAHWNGSGGDEDTTTGTLAFVPALDPKAERLEIMPTGLCERAVISFPLRWAGEAT